MREIGDIAPEIICDNEDEDQNYDDKKWDLEIRRLSYFFIRCSKKHTSFMRVTKVLRIHKVRNIFKTRLQID